ncbi:hypothetical protein J2Y55_004594 [Bosea sp. BE125]|uniref:hypothetical protein n=1 Tax=Bosea sp. BE125 TaxID=2817909 RepID=UPI002862F653|nr:hypothetical protein [Bosea sp. BE125]MDR6873567.1 hypothetical protein [Bosea sp. BE125]
MSSNGPDCDLSPIRLAIEDIVQRQGKSLYEAAFWSIVFAASLVEDRLGKDDRDRVIANAVGEMDKARVDTATARSAPIRQARKRARGLPPKSAAPDYRGMIFSILRITSEEISKAGIPNEEVPPVLADYTAMLALAMGQQAGLEAIIARMGMTLEDYVHHRPPFDERR